MKRYVLLDRVKNKTIENGYIVVRIIIVFSFSIGFLFGLTF